MMLIWEENTPQFDISHFVSLAYYYYLFIIFLLNHISKAILIFTG